MTIIHTFYYDPDFIRSSSIVDPVLRSGGVGVLSPQSLSYFVNPQEIPDERTTRGTSLNALLVKVPRLIVDQTEFTQFLTDVQDTWSSTERQNLFSIIDYLLFAYNASATTEQVELALSAWSQYVASSYVYSNTTSVATAYLGSSVTLTVPDFVTFSFKIANATQYQIRVWVNNSTFNTSYPLSTISAIVPPLTYSDLYTVNLVSGINNVFATALESSQISQITLQSYIQTGEYSGFIAQDVTFFDVSGNSAVVQFNLLYKGTIPGVIAIRTALRNALLTSGVGAEAGWKIRAPSLFVTQAWYLLPLWENKTSLVSSYVFPNIIPLTTLTSDATRTLYDVPSGFITTNIDVLTTYYNNLTLAAVPDQGNSPSRLSLLGEHPTYQDVPPTNSAFNYQTTITQNFSNLLAAALAVAAGNPNTNVQLTVYTAPGDNRTYVSFSVSDVEYYVITEATYNALI